MSEANRELPDNPFVNKSTGVPIAKIAASGPQKLKDIDFNRVDPVSLNYYIKEAVLPFNRFRGVILGPR